MCALWRSLHDDLMRSIGTISFKKTFDTARQSSPRLQQFADHYALLDYLHTSVGELDAKDRLIASMVAEAQRSGPSAETATVLLWLALWPGLDALYRRHFRYFAKAPDELVSEISDRFMAVLHRFEASRVRRVAATILRNTERLIRHELRGEWQRAGRTDPASDEDLARLAFARQQGRPETEFGFPPGTDSDTATAMLCAVLVPLIGADAQLVIAVAVLGEPQNEAAARLAVSPCAARKRYQRAVARLRMCLDAA
jgi:DNA-directed RNA polymerase specialized sigma24 family protein